MPSATTSETDIQFHYDVSNEFYALWLDETMTYSAALWDGIDPNEPDASALARAQRAKFAHHLNLAQVPVEAPTGGDRFRLLDVGCGWGGLLDFAVGSCRVSEASGLTLSRAQLEHIEAHARPGVRVTLESWETHRPAEPYDAIVSVGAFEHFVTAGTPREQRVAAYASYFERCHALLRPGASMSLQTIAYDGVTEPDGPVSSFVASHIFPGGTLPRLAEITAACDRYFSIQVLTSRTDDYAKTLATWSSRLTRARAEAREIVGADVLRRYRIYLRACETIFLRGALTLYRIGLKRRDEPLR